MQEEALVSATGAALMPMAQQLVASTATATWDTAVDQKEGGDVDATKKLKKVDKGKCYQCGFPGHVLAGCKAVLYDNCEAVDHATEECALLEAPKTSDRNLWPLP